MQFQPVSENGTVALILGRGEIIQGDFDRLHDALGAVPAGKRIGLLLDSPGGLVGEAEKMGHLIRDDNIAVVIPEDSKCVSACFLLLAAARHRLAANDALVGVHSASESGEETVTSMAVTTAMARVAADFDVPPGILGKMVRTVPGRVEWLTHEDLRSMDVTFIDGTDSPPAQQRLQQAMVQPPPVRPAPPVPSPAPPTTFRPPAPEPMPATPVTVAEFKGAYFCGGPSTVLLRVMDVAGDGRRRAVFTFAPTDTNPRAGRGAFVVEGRLDLGGGVLDMRPVPGSSQPPGAQMVGLLGRSNDGGRTFEGRVTASASCTLFTLRRER